ncbi:DUF6233 domain-containing protein [Streptomyces nigrescens]|uniref:DUF6233 domain-containing protein n=1 Tax=Streptomyces nigrescens TaxID=1920 RepID=A0A640TBZ9_STRNI|nr:DUF6233 domain-containing protein [Streptomyces libani]WAT94846.1 DUF6233 domain-containing protein [Streptomyces libani subsp. libani]GFE19991.1 hypothetical protein Sliba_04440 [Streptomyces libani subsp. libani]GGV85476.1 hypothetical protein GCM10010500_01970 [Streptomyces libani subsp. libani]
MSELPPDLPRLRTLETWLQLTLDQVRQAITVAQQQAALQQRAVPPPPPDWVLQLRIDGEGQPIAVHVGGCRTAGRRARPISRDQAMRAIAEGLEPCGLCRPDTELGIL